MNRSAFRRFEFFDVDTIAEDMTSVLGSVPVCAAAEGGMLIFGDNSGNIIISDRNFHISERKHKVFRGEVKGISYLFDPANHSRQYIIAIGDDSKAKADNVGDDGSNGKLYLIKVFSATDMSRPLQVLNATLGENTLTSFAVLSDATQIAVGFDSGTVLLFSGMFLKENTGRAPPPIALLPKHKYQVTGLHFCELAIAKNNERRIRLFAVLDGASDETADSNQKPPEPSILGEDPSNAGMLVFDTSVVMNSAGTGFAPAARHPPKVLDERGAAVKCSSLMKGTSELVVGRGEAVYNYSVEDRGGALAIFGEKLCVCAVGRYTLVVSVDEKPAAPANPPPGGTAATLSLTGGSAVVATVAAGETSKPRKPNVNIYDLKNKIICGTTKKYQLPVGEKIVFVLHDGGCVYLVTSSWSLIRFREKDTSRKLEMLLEKSDPPLYSLAIMVAAEEQVETAEIMKLYKSYGDHLYKFHEFDLAIAQYSHTIGYIPPSYVVMKFLDPYRISNLISYLERLHEKGLASKDHITLLLTCYTKIKDEPKLKDLLGGLITHKGTTSSGIKDSSDKSSAASAIFDAEQTIVTLNTAGYTDYALQIAAKYHQHQAYLNIQLTKTPPQLDDALGYLAYLVFVSPPETITQILKKHGRQLLKSRAKAFTALLVKLCTGDYAALLPSVNGIPSTAAPTSGNKQSNSVPSTELIRALSGLLGEDIELPTSTVNPSDLLSLYCDDKESLLVLLEGVEEASKGRILHPRVSTTLMELYLHNYSVQKEKLKLLGSVRELEVALQAHESNIMRILDGAYTSYDTAHALLLVHSFGFERGERFLLEKQQSIELVIRILIEANDSREVFKVLRREGSKDPELYHQVLAYFVRQTMDHKKSSAGGGGSSSGSASKVRGGKLSESRDSDDSDHSEDEEDDENKWDAVIDVIDLIEKDSILSPVQVMSILAINPHLPLQVAANYIAKSLKDLTDDISQCENQVRGALANLEGISQSTADKTQAKLLRAAKLQEKALQRRQQQQHRHDHHHYNDDDDDEEEEEETEEDAKLQEEKEQERWTTIRKAQLACSQEHEAFYKELELSADGFSTVAGFFGRSIIN